MKGDIIKADVIDINDDGICTIIVYAADSELLKNSFYQIKDKWYNNENEVVISFKIPLKEVEEIKHEIQWAEVVGFNIETGIALHILQKPTDSKVATNVDMVFTFTDDEKEVLQIALAKAMLLN